MSGGVAQLAGPPRVEYERKLTLFTFLLAGAIIFHQSKLGDWEVFSPHALVTLSAIWCMFRPSSTGRLVLMLGVHLVSVAIDMPLVVNHWLLLAFLELGLFAAIGIGRIRGDGWVADRAALYRVLAPYVRLLVVLVYAVAALAKVNAGFLDPAISCGADMLGDLVARIPGPLDADFLDRPAIYATIAIEIALPVFLSIRATRIPAVFLGGGFHLTLALAGHLPFSGFAFAFYALFTPDDLPARFDRVREDVPALDSALRRVQATARSPLAFPLVAVAFLGLAALITYGPDQAQLPVNRVFLGLIVVYALVLGGLFALCVLRGRPFPYQDRWLGIAHPALAIGVALVVLNAASPYLGLKTQSTFTMYSNIQTEGENWNHELVPQDLQIFDFQDDVVQIVDSSDPYMARAAELDRDWVWWDLRAWAADHPSESITYERDGEVVTAERAGDDPELGQEPNPVVQKLFFFRDAPTAAGNDCRVNRDEGAHQGS